MEEPPGPPLSQMANGALAGSFRDSKNQKNLSAKGQSLLCERNVVHWVWDGGHMERTY